MFARRVFAITALWLLGAGPTHAQSPSYASATRKGAPSTCPSGAFIDVRLDDWSAGPQCWSCPSGYIRTLDPVTSATACFKDGGTDHEEAKFKHKWLCDGDEREFFDPRKGGECWKCPKSKPRRTAYAVTSDKACATKEVFGEKLGEATYVRKVKTCKDGAFFDPRKGGECWKCPSGYGRTTDPVTSKKACVKEVADSFARAKLENQLGCPSGQFLDPRNGGECWQCPASHPHRTVSAVTTARACTDNPLGIVPSEPNALCLEIVRALDKVLDEGDKASKSLEEITRPILQPVAGVLQKQLAPMTELVGDLEPLNAMVEKAERALKPLERLADPFADITRIRKALLNADLCALTPQALEDRVKALFDLPLRRDTFVTVSFGVTFSHSVYRATAQLGLTVLTNLQGDGGLFVSGRIGATSTEDPFAVGVSAMLYPESKLDDFGLTPVPAITVSVAKGNAFDQLFGKHPKVKAMTKVIDGIDVSWSPASPSKLPTFGVSKSLYTKEGTIPKLLDFTATAGWDFAILTWSGNKLR